jgi:hypothetical protein
MPEDSEIEQFWEDLLDYIEDQDRRVIPVVGAELLTVQDGGRPVSLYRAVADRLLNKYGLAGSVPLRKNHELNDAVCALAAKGKPRVHDLYGPIHSILQKLIAEQKGILDPLRELAGISHFSLFATTTPDDLLARALNAVRFGGKDKTREIEYAPKLSTERRTDIPENLPEGYTAVFYLFGKANPGPFYAIHDEDSLEFAYTLQAGNGPEYMFSQLRERDLLLIGCPFAGWLSRFFLRLSNLERLYSDRAKKEFLVGEESARDHDLMVFLQRFSQDTRCYPGDARVFLSELYDRWRARNPLNTSVPPASHDIAVFISYAEQDLGAAVKLQTNLQQISDDVAWLDKSALKPGEDWAPAIRSAIQRCTLFLPLLSANTERRTDGYFRLEWTLAAERCLQIQGRKFIFPIVIDSEFTDPLARYSLVPEKFKDFQYSHAPEGQITSELRHAIKEALREQRRG